MILNTLNWEWLEDSMVKDEDKYDAKVQMKGEGGFNLLRGKITFLAQKIDGIPCV